MTSPIHYAESHQDTFRDELIDFLRIPSISTDTAFHSEVIRCGQWLVDHMNGNGIATAELFLTDGHPIVYGECTGAANGPVLLVYGHYDVQPPDPESEWNSDPFEPEVRDGSIFARGASDDKAQVFLILKAIQSIIQVNGQSPCTIKVVIEGEEECGSNCLARFIQDNSEMLACDTVLICDTAMISRDIPAITVSLRGNVYVELNLKGSGRDLHSGVYGGAVENPLHVLCNLIAGLHDRNNRVTLPGFYDDVIRLSSDDRRDLAGIPFDEKAWLNAIGVSRPRTEKGYTVLESTTVRPALDVHGIWGGYSGEGGKTVIPAVAGAKFSFRTVANQDNGKLFSGLKDYFESHVPDALKYELKLLNTCGPVQVDVGQPAIKVALNALEQTFQTKPFFAREGGSIPIVSEFKRALDADSILMGFGLEEDAIHAPNEHFGLDRFQKGIEAVVRFIELFSCLGTPHPHEDSIA